MKLQRALVLDPADGLMLQSPVGNEAYCSAITGRDPLGVDDACTVQEWQMTFLEYTLENTPTKVRSECPKCKTPMYLARIAPDEPGFDRRFFECPRCQHVDIAQVKFK
jgi:predicted Zn-ribbon and HTH transcriptional regulator